MIRLSLNIVVGLFLAGCTVNNFHSGAFTSLDYNSYASETNVIHTEQKAKEGVPSLPAPAIVGNRHIKPECGPYLPLLVPKPVRIDLKELESAQSSIEINAIVLRNVRTLNQQMLEYAARQQKHYAEYVGRCVVK